MPLLRLPQEIKNRIYELVLGGKLLHIDRDAIKLKSDDFHPIKGHVKKPRFTNQVCCSRISDEEAQNRFDTGDGDTIYFEDVKQRH